MTMTGKRKREVMVMGRSPPGRAALDECPSQLLSDAQKVFKQYFEGQFEPLDELALSTSSVEREAEGREEDQQDQTNNESDMSEWEGIPDADTTFGAVEVIKHEVVPRPHDVIVNNTEIKTFMGAKPPGTRPHLATVKSQPKTTRDDEMEAANLKHDLDLQRLLQESSLLKKQREGSKADRHRMTDLRLQSLGLKSSLYSQEKMPMAHRLGIKAKAHSREELRRKDARENGIILEKDAKKVSSDKRRRERGVDAPGVGKFRDGTLKLSGRDVADIQGPKQDTHVGRGRRRRK